MSEVLLRDAIDLIESQACDDVRNPRRHSQQDLCGHRICPKAVPGEQQCGAGELDASRTGEAATPERGPHLLQGSVVGRMPPVGICKFHVDQNKRRSRGTLPRGRI
jgi:hypothetical protein